MVQPLVGTETGYPSHLLAVTRTVILEVRVSSCVSGDLLQVVDGKVLKCTFSRVWKMLWYGVLNDIATRFTVVRIKK